MYNNEVLISMEFIVCFTFLKINYEPNIFISHKRVPSTQHALTKIVKTRLFMNEDEEEENQLGHLWICCGA